MNPSLNLWGAWFGWEVGGDWGGRWWEGGGIVTGTSLVVSKKMPATFGDFFFSKNSRF